MLDSIISVIQEILGVFYSALNQIRLVGTSKYFTIAVLKPGLAGVNTFDQLIQGPVFVREAVDFVAQQAETLIKRMVSLEIYRRMNHVGKF